MIAVVGEALVDLVVRSGASEPVAHPGGGPANIALGLARLGHRVTLLTQLGEDAYGREVREHLEHDGVVVEDHGPPGTPTSTALARLDADGVAQYEFDLGWDVRDLRLPPGTRALHTGSLGLALDPGRTAVLELMRSASGPDGPLLSYDPNARPTLTPDRDDAAAWVERVARTAHVVKMSEEDLEFLFPGRTPEQLADAWLAGPVTALVVVTHGGDGVFGASRAARARVAAPRIEVVDTVGAGDAFMSGLIDALDRLGLLRASRARAVGELDEVALRGVLTDAALVAAITCTRAGADPPTAADLVAARG